LLEEAINGQIVLEEKLRDEQTANQQLTKETDALKGKLKHAETDMAALKTKSEETAQ
jgi:hypothetical protein